MLRRASAKQQIRLGEALRRLIDLAAHRSGAVLAIMEAASVTLPQVLLLDRVAEIGPASLSELAEGSRASTAAMSQMIDRLVQQSLLRRGEDPADRRRKAIAATARARALLRRLAEARSADYELGLAPISPNLRQRLIPALEQAVAELERAGKDDRGLSRKKDDAL